LFQGPHIGKARGGVLVTVGVSAAGITSHDKRARSIARYSVPM